jgi:hypothetical protein
MWGFERIIEGERKRKNRFSCWRMRAAGIVLFDDEASFFFFGGRKGYKFLWGKRFGEIFSRKDEN